ARGADPARERAAAARRRQPRVPGRGRHGPPAHGGTGRAPRRPGGDPRRAGPRRAGGGIGRGLPRRRRGGARGRRRGRRGRALAGLFAFRGATVQHFPDVDLPMVVVTASLPGTAPAQMETEVARRLENAMATMTGLRHLHTTVQDGVATIAAEFRLEKDPQQALDDTRAAVARVRSDLPPALRDPVVRRIEFKNAPILTYTVASQRLDEEALSWLVDDLVTRRLLAVPGVGAVRRIGGVDRQVRVELDPDQLLALRVGAADVSRRLLQLQREAPGGRARLGGGEQTVRTRVEVPSADALRALELPLSDGRIARLDQVATVTDGRAE